MSDAPTSRRVLFLLASARTGGNTELLARHAASALEGGVEQAWLRLSDHPLPAFHDVRHDEGVGGTYPMPLGSARLLLDETLAATDVVVAAPLYWYNLPSSAKLYLDHWSGWLRVPGLDFKARMGGKTLWAITTVSDEDRSLADPLVRSLELTAAYMRMPWGGSLIGYGNRPGDVLKDAGALESAKALLRRSDAPAASAQHGSKDQDVPAGQAG